MLEESILNGKHLFVWGTILIGDQPIKTHAPIDHGATGICLVDKSCACHHQLYFHALKTPRNIEVIDRYLIELAAITHITQVCLAIQGHHNRNLPMFITKLGVYPILLGFLWL